MIIGNEIKNFVNKELVDKVLNSVCAWETQENGFSKVKILTISIIQVIGLTIAAFLTCHSITGDLIFVRHEIFQVFGWIGITASLFSLMGLIYRLDQKISFASEQRKFKNHYQKLSHSLQLFIETHKNAPKNPLILPNSLFNLTGSYLTSSDWRQLGSVDRRCRKEHYNKFSRSIIKNYIKISSSDMWNELNQIEKHEENNRLAREWSSVYAGITFYAPYISDNDLTYYSSILSQLPPVYTYLSDSERTQKKIHQQYRKFHNQFLPKVINRLLEKLSVPQRTK